MYANQIAVLAFASRRNVQVPLLAIQIGITHAALLDLSDALFIRNRVDVCTPLLIGFPAFFRQERMIN